MKANTDNLYIIKEVKRKPEPIGDETMYNIEVWTNFGRVESIPAELRKIADSIENGVLHGDGWDVEE